MCAIKVIRILNTGDESHKPTLDLLESGTDVIEIDEEDEIKNLKEALWYLLFLCIVTIFIYT